MSENDTTGIVGQIEKISSDLKDDLQQLADEARQLDRKRAALANRASAAIDEVNAKIPENLSDDEADELETELRDSLSDLAYSLGMTWNGDWDYGDWQLGEKVEFWVPSTC